jgi:hypothetical protein
MHAAQKSIHRQSAVAGSASLADWSGQLDHLYPTRPQAVIAYSKGTLDATLALELIEGGGRLRVRRLWAWVRCTGCQDERSNHEGGPSHAPMVTARQAERPPSGLSNRRSRTAYLRRRRKAP